LLLFVHLFGIIAALCRACGDQGVELRRTLVRVGAVWAHDPGLAGAAWLASAVAKGRYARGMIHEQGWIVLATRADCTG